MTDNATSAAATASRRKVEWLPREELLSFEEIARLVRVLAAMGVEEVWLTGGEPLVRRDLSVARSQLARSRA